MCYLSGRESISIFRGKWAKIATQILTRQIWISVTLETDTPYGKTHMRETCLDPFIDVTNLVMRYPRLQETP